MMIGTAEYIWLDGKGQLRSKARVIQVSDQASVHLKLFPQWSYDGSSTYQSPGNHSDLLLNPVFFCINPLRKGMHFLVMCEVLTADNLPHNTNTRALLRTVLEAGAAEQEPWMGFEQEYVLKGLEGRVLGFPEKGFPPEQGPYYCSVGASVAFGRPLVEEHLEKCLEAQLLMYGINGEVLPGQWEFQIGYRGFGDERADPLKVSDQLWIARWLLHRIAEEHRIQVSFENKPVAGNWNGSGCHTNFSTRRMRKKDEGLEAIEIGIQRLSARHAQHIAVYGEKLSERLTGLHETCHINEFRAGIAHRGASVRIPQQVKNQGYGYLEDRRPGANCDPYLVSARLLVTLCGLEEEKITLQAPQFQTWLQPA